LDGPIKGRHPESTSVPGGFRFGLAISILLVVWGWLSNLSAFADDPLRLGLYVQFEDGSTVTQCVELDGPEATGLDVLRQAEIDLVYETGGFLGTAICKIGETGCNYPVQDCFCQCLGKSCQYWTYWYGKEDQWNLSSLGASGRVVKDGDYEGWVWGDGKASPPPELLTEDICNISSTATRVTRVKVEERDTDPTPLPTRATSVPLLTRTVVRTESEVGSLPSLPQVSPPAEAATPTRLPSPSTGSSPAAGSRIFVWLIVGLSGLGIVTLALAYFSMRKQP
jgi:hypothetical protein